MKNRQSKTSELLLRDYALSELGVTNKQSAMILETAVGSPILAQHLDSSSITKKVFITNKVTSDFFEKLPKSICYPRNARPTAVSRMMKRRQARHFLGHASLVPD